MNERNTSDEQTKKILIKVEKVLEDINETSKVDENLFLFIKAMMKSVYLPGNSLIREILSLTHSTQHSTLLKSLVVAVRNSNVFMNR